MAPQRMSSQRRATTISYQATPNEQLRNSTLKSVFAPIVLSLLGPLILLYLVLRCEKMPLIVPTHYGAFFSTYALILVPAFIALMFFVKLIVRPPKQKAQLSMNSGLTSLILISMVLIGITYIRQEYLDYIYSQFLHMYVAMVLFCVVFVVGLMIVSNLVYLSKPQFDLKGRPVAAFFWGTHTNVWLSSVELKSFFYINTGLVMWGAIDLLIFLHYVNHSQPTGSLIFLVFSQLLFIGHSLLFEHFLSKKPYRETEGLGFFWLMRVLLYLPFFHSLPVLYASETDIALPKPALLADLVVFFFGFVIYLSAVHQKENFNADPGLYKNLQSINTNTGRRFLTSGYWSLVQKPDYLGYMIMWLSWAIACGFSGVSLLVLFTVYITTWAWQQQLYKLNSAKYGTAWQRYVKTVKFKLLPLVH